MTLENWQKSAMAIRKEIKKITGIVIRKVDYKDSDQIIEILSKEGRFSFLAKGVKKLTSKNASSLLLLTKGTYTLLEGPQGGLSLKEGSIERTIAISEDPKRVFALNFLSELSRSFINETSNFERLFCLLDKILEEINRGYDPLSASLLFFANLLKENGLTLNVSECVRCGNKRDIIGISYRDGGFICKHHLESESEKRSVYELKVLRYSFLVPLGKIGMVSFENKTTLKLLREWGSFVLDNFGYKITSLKLLSMF